MTCICTYRTMLLQANCDACNSTYSCGRNAATKYYPSKKKIIEAKSLKEKLLQLIYQRSSCFCILLLLIITQLSLHTKKTMQTLLEPHPLRLNKHTREKTRVMGISISNANHFDFFSCVINGEIV